jgi:hypothetical protein
MRAQRRYQQTHFLAPEGTTNLRQKQWSDIYDFFQMTERRKPAC